MQVKVRLFGGLREYLPAGSAFNHCELSLPQGATLSDLLSRLPIPENKTFLVMLNDVKVDSHAYAGTPVSASDEIVLIPPIKGG